MSGPGQRTAVALVAVAVASSAGVAGASDEPSAPLVSQLWSEVKRLVDAAVAPDPVPPEPVEVKWKSRRWTSVDLGAPLLALAAADVDGDGTAELVALTTREVLVLERSGARRVKIAARASLPDEPALQQSRDPVGVLVVADADGDGVLELYARTSAQARGALLRWRDGALEHRETIAAFPLCAHARAQLAPGRNYFAGDQFRWTGAGKRPAVADRFYAGVCASFVDGAGWPVELFGAVDTEGTLVVQRTDAAGERREVRKRGVAFAIADVDNDGSAEIITSTNRAPGRGDQIHVYGVRNGAFVRINKSKKFTGGVAAIAVGDIDGDGDRDVVAAIRLIGSNRVDLWTLNK